MTGLRRLAVPALLLVLAGCSTVPMNSATVQITQDPARPDEIVGIEPLPPEPGATPEEIVRAASSPTVRPPSSGSSRWSRWATSGGSPIHRTA